ncbi:hypothetical protein BwSF12_77550 [Bradyrhizobium ottawaense]|uniref:hypothetical protein n=2 Tax=Bradyrhizobium ottawaense TaxID=931866 RepID=UPI0027D62217|nr:hypothetical protein BwSF12_77550 [Bradyrhizobium ottawaense]
MQNVMAVAGRRVDPQGASASRFPVSRVEQVRSLILSRLSQGDIRKIVCSAACGADLLTLDVAADLSIAARIILPSTTESFKISSVLDRAPQQAWSEMYDRAVSAAAKRGDLILNVGDNSSTDYGAVNDAILDSACSLAGGNPSSVVALIIWDGQPHPDERDLTVEFKNDAEVRRFALEQILTL